MRQKASDQARKNQDGSSNGRVPKLGVGGQAAGARTGAAAP